MCDLNWSLGTGVLTPLVISTTSLHRKDSMSLATLKVSNEMSGMQALKVTETARD
jgi:hypothetical protein